MHDGLFGAAHRLERFFDDVFARLREHLNGNVVGNKAVLYELAAKRVFGVAGRGKAYFYFLESHGNQTREKFHLFV